jgi:uncharacterized metal-binding protein YceD (DUF177 family)
MTPTPPRHRWHVPVRLEEVPQAGLHIEIVADAVIRAELAALAGLRELPRLKAAIDVTREGDGLRVRGMMSATVGQTCVITLEPLEAVIDEPFDVVFVPAGARALSDADEDAEPLLDGTADLGAIAAEFLLLGIDRYPKAPGAVFAAPAHDGADGETSPFAALAKRKSGSEAR